MDEDPEPGRDLRLEARVVLQQAPPQEVHLPRSSHTTTATRPSATVQRHGKTLTKDGIYGWKPRRCSSNSNRRRTGPSTLSLFCFGLHQLFLSYSFLVSKLLVLFCVSVIQDSNLHKSDSSSGRCLCVSAPRCKGNPKFKHKTCRGQELSLGVSCQRRRPQGGVKTYLHEAGMGTRVLAASQTLTLGFNVFPLSG